MAKKTATPAALDLGALDLNAEAELPQAMRVVESRKWDVNPFVEPLRSTIGAERGKMVQVPAYHAREIASGIRDAAEKLTKNGQPTGVRIIFRLADGKDITKITDVPNDDQPVQVLYAAKQRRRSLDADQTAEAVKYGFVNPETNRVQVKPYLDWVDAGRPMESQDEHQGE